MNFIEFDDDVFIKFKELIYQEAGIKLTDLKKALIQARLSKRLRFLGLSSYRDYYNYLIDNYNEEKIEFINAITTNKTEFFREFKHFDYMRDNCFPDFIERGKKTIKIWSAGCSTGEEPYSIAITVKEFFGSAKTPEIKILATDIDTNVLEKAYAGMYTLEQVKDIDVSVLKKYFMRGTGGNEGLFKVKDEIRKMVTIRRLNLLEDAYPMKGKMDIIFCRNVIIYFDRPTQKVLFERFGRYLDDDGYLFIGHSENLTSITNRFTLLGHTIYRKSIMQL
ncbi:MAG: protein-glutamate O-methyltransferase [Spirochaetes bacterium]|nr:protein-glutamate O-methyltransferase [Spirochaetota bacterium]